MDPCLVRAAPLSTQCREPARETMRLALESCDLEAQRTGARCMTAAERLELLDVLANGAQRRTPASIADLELMGTQRNVVGVQPSLP
jgi:hypothetical protein